jgi:hypothetical protein
MGLRSLQGYFYLPMKEIVIYCPCESHEKERHHKRHDGSTKRIAPCPKILMKVSPGTKGEISVQCSDITCRTHNKKTSDGKFNSWYSVDLNGLGANKITPIPIPVSFNEIEIVPVAIMGVN